MADADLVKQATDDVRRMSTGMNVMGGNILVAVATVFAARLIAAAIYHAAKQERQDD